MADCTRYDEKPELTEPESKFEHHEFDYDDQNEQNDEHGFERLKSKLEHYDVGDDDQNEQNDDKPGCVKVLPEGDKNEMDTAAAELGHNHLNTDGRRVTGGLTELVHNQAKSVPSAVKKKVWAKGKNGLFSWKTQKAAKTLHANKYSKHTSHSGLKFSFQSRLQPNRGYKKPNRNTDIFPMIFVSYSRIRIFKKGIRIRMKGIRFLKSLFLCKRSIKGFLSKEYAI